MNWRFDRTRLIYLGLFLLSILFVFFLARKFDTETGERYWSFDTQGVQYFRKGLDVSGGTRLTYKISYDKYEQLYHGAELHQVKQNIEDILFKQIDKRISNLGVADAKVYKQLMDGKTYINVDIGGVSDLDQAKNIIGKTVELEFRLPSEGEPSVEDVFAREQLALELQKELVAHPESFAKLSENKGSESIYYSHLTGLTIDQMPPLLNKNVKVLDTLGTGQVAPELFTGVYTYTQVPDGSGSITLQPVNGYAIVLLNDKKVVELQEVSKKDVIDL